MSRWFRFAQDGGCTLTVRNKDFSSVALQWNALHLLNWKSVRVFVVNQQGRNKIAANNKQMSLNCL